MSKFHNQLALVSVSVIALVAGSIYYYERAAHEAELAAEAAAQAAEEERLRAEAEAALAEREAEAAAMAQADAVEADTGAEVAEAPAATQDDEAAQTVETQEIAVADESSLHGHGDAGTAPIASIIAGAAVAQSVDSPAIDATGVTYGLGREALPEEIAAWDIDVRPDGQGLPEGSGDVWTGEEVFIEKCAACHGDFAEGLDRWPVLAGGWDSLTHDRPEKTIGSYWPYLSTVFDYVHRAMPYGDAQSLTADEVYAITAYLLYSNAVVEDDFTLSHENFTEVRLPNEDGFFMDDREEGEIPQFTREPCMENCKDEVQITMRAVILDVTPDAEGTEGMDLEGGGGASAPAAGETVETASVAPATDEAPASGAAPVETDQVETAAAEPDPALVAQGEAAFRQCQACHQIGEGAANRVGPHLNDVMGRTAGSLDGFRYSPVMAEAGEGGLVWTSETLHDFLANPRDYLRGTKMSFAGFRDESDIAAVTAYVSTFSD
ncbi:MAG: c-type cytochrome [Paracoccaceae bacterium]|jgi:cytochrome c|nr:c-type cytochrome [Paracoccaceae bacterium]